MVFVKMLDANFLADKFHVVNIAQSASHFLHSQPLRCHSYTFYYAYISFLDVCFQAVLFFFNNSAINSKCSPHILMPHRSVYYVHLRFAVTQLEKNKIL